MQLPAEIAIVKNTSEGIATVATGIAWKQGDIVVAFDEEFPANFYPGSVSKRKASKSAGSPSSTISIASTPPARARGCSPSASSNISAAIVSIWRASAKSARATAVSFSWTPSRGSVRSPSTFAPPNRRAGRRRPQVAARTRGLRNPLRPPREFQDDIEPVEFGWTNVAKYYDYSSRDMALRADAGRYECGTLNTIGCYGLRASIEFLALSRNRQHGERSPGAGRSHPERRNRARI